MKNSPKLKRRRWNGGELPEEDSTSPGIVEERSDGAAASSVKVSDVVERRRRRGASRRRCKFSVLSVWRRSVGDRGTEEEDDRVG
jgi:hypothetical protein